MTNCRHFCNFAAGALITVVVLANPVKAANYPADYQQLVEASTTEDGLLVHSVITKSDWTNTLAGFQTKYPWIKVETLDLSNEIWDRTYTERSTGARTADVIVAFGVDRWLECLKKGEAVNHRSPEAAELADWVNPRLGLRSAVEVHFFHFATVFGSTP